MIGSIREVWRYPVKSMQGERCASLRLDAGERSARGFEGDRRWALVDPSSGRAHSAKTVPELLFASARLDGQDTVITLPAGDELLAGDPATTAALGAWLGRDVDLVCASDDLRSAYEMTFDPPDDDAELFEIPSPEGTFFDLTAVHLITTASLAAMAGAHPDGQWDVRRFRPNLVLEVADPPPLDAADPAAYPEDAWVGQDLSIGADGAVINVLMRTVRCAIPLRAQPGIDRDVDIYRTMAAHHDNHLGAYCVPVAAGLVREGDTITPVGGTDGGAAK